MDGGYLSDWLGTSYPRRGDFSISDCHGLQTSIRKRRRQGKRERERGEGRGWLDLSEMRGKSCPWQW